jgi:hypothetical protein
MGHAGKSFAIMSLLNLTNDGKRGVLVAIYRLLLSEKSLDSDRLLSLCAPAELCDEKNTRDTLNTWVELGLFERSPHNKISISPLVPAKDRREDLLPIWASRRVLAPENNTRFWEAENSRCADFTRATAWLLAQDVYDAEYSSWDVVLPIMKIQTPGNDGIFGQNNTRWNGLRAWAPFLGFGSVGNTKGSPFIIDPTDALRHALPIVFGKRTTLAADEFLNAVAETVPVLDQGTYRRLVEDKLRAYESPDGWLSPPTGQLSTSLSRAVLRLTSDGTLQGKKDSDFPSRVRLTGRKRVVVAEYSHFSLRRPQ